MRTNEVVRANDTSGGETLVAVQEEGNPLDRHTVAIVKDGSVIGHLPKKYSQTFRWFIHRGALSSA